MNTQKIFISGASGFQGGPTAQLLIDKGYEVVSLKREIAEESSTNPNLTLVEGGFENKEALNKALQGVTAAVFTLPLVFDQELAISMVNNFISAVKEQGVGHVVYNTSFDLPEEPTGLLAIDIKLAIKERLDEADLNLITISPDIYIDNLSAPWSIPLVVEQGILPYPVKNGQKVPWISHTDLARFTVAAIEKKELVGAHLPIGGNLLTGEEIAEEIAQQMGKPVQFISLAPDEFEQNLAPGFGPVMAKEIANLYRFLDENIDRITAKNYTDSQNKLEVEPQPLKDWVGSVAWK